MATTNGTARATGGTATPKAASTSTSTLLYTEQTLDLLRQIGGVQWKEHVQPGDEIFLYDMLEKAAKYKSGLIVTERQLTRVIVIRDMLARKRVIEL